MISFWFICICFQVCISCTRGQSVTLKNWTEASATLPEANRNLGAAYNKNSRYPDCIFVFGGIDSNNAVYCYSYTNNTIIYWGELDSSLTNDFRTQPAGLIISNSTDDLLYYTSQYCHIVQYDLQNKISTTLNSQLYEAGWRGCSLVQNPLNSDQFLTLNGYSRSSETATYDVIANSVTYGKNLVNTILFRPFVVAINDDFDNKNSYPFVYVMAGEMNTIQKLDLSKSDNISEIEWEILNVTLNLNNGDYNSCDAKDWSQIIATGGVQYENWIYIIGGHDTSSNMTRNCIIAFDWINEKVEYASDHPQSIARYTYA